MAEISIKIPNLQAIRAGFLAAPQEMTVQLNRAIAKSLIKIEGRSKQHTPVDTGRLRASTRTILGNLKGEVGTHTDYDMYVHWGTHRMQPRPYLLQAVNESERDVESYFVQAVDNVLSKIARNI